MPIHDGIGLDNDEGFGPTRPIAAEGNPEDWIQPVQLWPWTLAFQHGELLQEGKDLQCAITAGLKERAERGKAREDRFYKYEPCF